MPHLDDLTDAKADVDPRSSPRKLFEIGEKYIRQADTSRSFGRPDLALTEYLKAYDIAVNIIPRHADWPKIQEDKTGLWRTHRQLLMDIKNFNFEQVKNDIRADNARTGVQPTRRVDGAHAESHGTPNATAVAAADTNGRKTPSGEGPNGLSHVSGDSPMRSWDVPSRAPPPTPPRAKPTIHPKPLALHGNAIKQASKPTTASSGAPASVSASLAEDLATRFANLRPQSKQQQQPPLVQDPRIKTQPIIPPRPSGPPPKPPIPPSSGTSLDASIPDMPKMPEAIYSPARGTVSAAAATLPSSTPRGLFTRTNSSLSQQPRISPATSTRTSTDGYFPSGSGSAPSGTPQSRPQLSLPDGETISAEELVGLISRGTKDIQVLIIDVRDRSFFDEGHIMSQSTICIEPEILQRENISAEQIAESMILSPHTELQRFERRDAYDLVVFYDEKSLQIPRAPSTDADATALYNLYSALVHFNFGHDLRLPPRLLKGGLDAWTDLMGENSLQTSDTLGSISRQSLRRPGPNSSWRGLPSPARTRFKVDQLGLEDIEKWQGTLRVDQLKSSTLPSPTIIRSTSDFLRRYPDVSNLQESMVGPNASPWVPATTDTIFADHDFPALPAPPTRPAPAVPRPSYNGLLDKSDDHSYADATSNNATASLSSKSPFGQIRRHRCGLKNPSQWCYANSISQAILATPGFGDVLADDDFVHGIPTVPNPATQDGKHPQIMSKLLAQLLREMRYGSVPVIEATTLMKYCRFLCNKASLKDVLFGGPAQQDANEFMEFLFAHIADETNVRRLEKKALDNSRRYSGNAINDSIAYWKDYSLQNESLIDKYFGFTTTTFRKCENCSDVLATYEYYNVLGVPIPEDVRGPATLSGLLAREYGREERVDAVECDRCRVKSSAVRQTFVSRFPQILAVRLSRHRPTERGGYTKAPNKITWDLLNEDFSHLFFSGEYAAQAPADAGPSVTGPFRYECYAVVVHEGSTVTSGHYTAWIRDGGDPNNSNAWLYANDSVISTADPSKLDTMFKAGSRLPYLAFFKRKP